MPEAGKWLVAAYQPVSLFSLRMTHATSKGGKTLVVPTPYVIKMALIDVCFRRYPAAEALPQARAIFNMVKGRTVRFRPPEHCVVQNTFIKVLDQSREKGDGPFRQTIVYREFAFFSGRLEIAVDVIGLDAANISTLSSLFAHINSFGKRGGFWQFLDSDVIDGPLIGFTIPRDQADLIELASYAMTQALDDFGEPLWAAKDGFERISTYDSGEVTLNKHRQLTLTAIPYRRRSAGRGFTWYERVPDLPRP